MSIDIIEELLAIADREVVIDRAGSLFRRGEAVRHLYMVIEGEICLLRTTAEGDDLVLQRAGPGSPVAEASLTATRYHCDAVARARTTVRGVPVAAVRRLITSSPGFALAWIARLSEELQATRTRAGILRLKGVGARLDAWLLATGSELPGSGQGVALAMEIGVTPEALYREIARRRTRHAGSKLAGD